MKSDIECLSCLFKQALNTVRLATSNRALHRKVLDRTADWIKKADLTDSPASVSTAVYRIVSEVTGVQDPYKEIKRQTNLEALRMLPGLKKTVEKAEDSLDAALHLAVAGNIIDLGIGHAYDMQKDVLEILNTSFAINDTPSFKKELKPGRKLLYIGDNAGEIVFDRILIEELLQRSLEILFVVKSDPIINDALMEDARIAGIADLVPVIQSGTDDIGVNLDRSSREFKEAFEGTDLILAKGHGNFESCDEMHGNFYFLLKTKCDVVASALKVNTGDIVFKHQHT
ncbi:MAG: ARMT1-like domain-containing protein [bacterium]